MISMRILKILASVSLVIYPFIEFIIAIACRQNIILNTDYSINISNWLIVKDIFSMFTIFILIFYYISKRISLFTYCISQTLVCFSLLFTFIWTCTGLIIYANQFELDDYDTPIVILGVFGGYLCLYNLYKLNGIILDYMEENKQKPLLDI